MYKNEPKWGESQAGRPTPATFRRATLWNMVLSTRSSSHKYGSGRIHKSRPKGLNQVNLGPNPMTTQRFRTQTDLSSSLQLGTNVPERRRPKPSQSQAGRPLTTLFGATQLPPTSGGNPRRPRKGGGKWPHPHAGRSRGGWSAPLVSLWCSPLV